MISKNQKCWEFLAISFKKCLPSLCIITKSGGKKPYEKPFQNSLHLEMYRGPYSFVFSASLHCDDFFYVFSHNFNRSHILNLDVHYCCFGIYQVVRLAYFVIHTFIISTQILGTYNKYTTLKSLKLRTFEFSFW